MKTKIYKFPLRFLIIASSLTLGSTLTLVSNSLAQSTTSATEGYQSNEQNSSFGNTNFGNGFNPIQLIHNAQFLNNRSAQEFWQESDRNLNTAVDDFKRIQQEKILQQQQQNNNTPSTSQ
jgi:hypothetical protein